MLQARSITKNYGNLSVLRGVDVDIKQGEIVAITGASGAGKSTLLHILGTLDRPDSGSYHIDGQDVLAYSENETALFRNKSIGFVFQFHHLLPEFTAIENICIPSYIHGAEKKATEKRALELLGFLGLEARAQHKPGELSGGEQQRVAVARALINEPSIIMADEPSGNLDSANSKELHQLFFDLRDKFGQTFIIVTHNKDLASMADRQLIMKDGQII